MVSWNFDTCIRCHGSGKTNFKECPLCKGFGLWEFVSDDNHLATMMLVHGEHSKNVRVKNLCGRRLAQVNSNNLEMVLELYEKEPSSASDYNALHSAGATNWGWAWIHANQFAIELCRLCGGTPAQHPVALSRMAWKWLTEEKQKKIDVPIDKLNPSLL